MKGYLIISNEDTGVTKHQIRFYFFKKENDGRIDNQKGLSKY